MDELKPCETPTFLQARFPTRDAVTAFIEQVQLWNAVAGLPVIRVRATVQPNQVILQSVNSARRGIVRLAEAFGGLAESATGDYLERSNRPLS